MTYVKHSHPAPERHKKKGHIVCVWPFLALLKLNKLRNVYRVFPTGRIKGFPPPAKNVCYNALKASFLAVVIAAIPSF